MNVLEANLLNSSMQNFTGTLRHNRDREEEAQLRREMMAARSAESQLDRAMQERQFAATERDRSENRRLQGEANANLKAYHDAMVQARTDDDKLRIINEMVKNGAVTPESLDAMSKVMSEKMGLQVTLKMPEKKDGFETRDSHNIQLAHSLRQRAAAALRNGGGDESERLNRMADQLERGVGRPLEDDRVTITEGIGEPDFPGGEPPIRATRKVAPDELETMRRTLGAPKAGAPAAGGASDRVTVISPGGKRGTIPRSQLEQAQKEGYKLAQ